MGCGASKDGPGPAMQSSQPGLPASPRKSAGTPKDKEGALLDLRPDKRGQPLELSLRQKRLIQLQHPDAARVVVKKLHGGFSGSLVLQTVAFDSADRPDQPAALKLDAAAALADEVEKHLSVQGQLGQFAIRIHQRPLYLGASGRASEQYKASEHKENADGAVMLELAGACWVLPEFFGKVADEQDIIVPFKQHLLEALASGDDLKNNEGVFEELYSVGGPLQRLACKATFGEAATAKGGFLASVLEDICREVTKALLPPKETASAAPESAYIVPASLLKATTGNRPLAPRVPVTKRDAFASSFVHECGEEAWGDAACAPLIALAKALRAQLKKRSTWLANWRPLRLQQHGDLNAANVLIDARGAIWLIDFATTGTHEAFCDAAKLVSVLVFEYLPCDDEAALRRGCAMIDALVPADGARQLWEEAPPMPERESSPAHALALRLAAMVQQKACEMAILISRREGRGGVAAADVHPAALWLPLLREALRCLRYGDLSVWQKRTAWHAVQRLSTALRAALQRQPVAPPERRTDEGTVLKLSQGQLVLLTAQAASCKGVSPDECYEVEPGGLHGLLLDQRSTVVPPDERAAHASMMVVAFEDICHEVGSKLPDAGASEALLGEAAKLAATRMQRAVDAASELFSSVFDKEVKHDLEMLLPDEGASEVQLGEAAKRLATLMKRAVEAADKENRFDKEVKKNMVELMQHKRTEEEEQRLQEIDQQKTACISHVKSALTEEEQQRFKVAARVAILRLAIQWADKRQTADSPRAAKLELDVQKRFEEEVKKQMVRLMTHTPTEEEVRRLQEIRLRQHAYESYLKRALTDEEQQRFRNAARFKILRLATRFESMRRAQWSALLLEDQTWTLAQMRETGVVEERRYAPGQQLFVLDTHPDRGTAWRIATVADAQEDVQHRLRLSDSPDGPERILRLHALNHAPLELCFKSFEVQRKKYTHRVSVEHAIIKESLSGRPLDALEQCIPIGMTVKTSVLSHSGASSLEDVHDVEALCHWLHNAHARRQRGERGSYAAVLLTAPPAAGKTCLISQMVIHTLKMEGEMLVPLVIKVMDLQRVLRMPEHEGHFADKWNWADAYCCALHGEASPTYRFLRQALLARRVLLLLDGMDEGGLGKTQIEQHVTEVLLPQGHSMLMTSRPDSLVRKVYEGCPQLQLCPLTHDQQRAVIAGRLSGSDVQDLVAYVRSLPPDDHGNLLSGNPLMLNMFISIYESRRVGNAKGVMPESLQEIYEMASNVMLERLDLKERGSSAKKDAEEVRWLLREVAIETHLRLKHGIYMNTLQQAAKRLGSSGQRVLEAVTEQLSNDRMPLLSVLEHEPLRVCFSHLTFQEYFAARAICAIKNAEEGRSYPGLQQPWKLAASWNNAVRLGADCGKSFGFGLLRAAGLEGKEMLDLDGKLEPDSKAAVAAVAEMILASGSLAELRLGSNEIGDAGAKALADALAANGSLATLNIDNNKIGVEGGKAIAEAVRACGSLTQLGLGGNSIGIEGAKAIAEAIHASGSLSSLNLYNNSIGPDGAKAIAEATRASGSLAALVLADNEICDEGAKALAAAVAASGSLTECNVRGNQFSLDAAQVFAKVGTERRVMLFGTKHDQTQTNLCGQRLGPADAVLVASDVAVSGSLTKLNLGWNKIGDEGAKALADGLAASGSLAHLNIGNNGIGKEGAKAIADAVAASGSLTGLDLSINSIGELSECTEAIAEAIRASGSLTSLSLSWNDIGDEGAKTLAEAVAASGSLAELWLGGNGIGDVGAKAIADALAASGSLTTLDLGLNQIRDAGAKAIADAVAASGSLTELWLNGNLIGDEGAKALAAGVAASGSLTTLNLFRNNIGPDKATANAEAIRASGSLTHLSMGGNSIGPEGAAALSPASLA